MFKGRLTQVGKRTPAEPTAELAGLWQRLELRLQTEDQTAPLWLRLQKHLAVIPDQLLLREELVLKPVQSEEGLDYLLSDPVRGRCFRLGEREAYILDLLDGERAVPELVQECATRFGAIPTPIVERFLQEIRLAGLLEEPTNLWSRLTQEGRKGPLVLWMLSHAEHKLTTLYRRLRFLSSRWTLAVILGLFLSAIVLLVLRWDILLADLAYLSSSWWLIPFLLLAFYLAMVPVILTHEVAHALTCIHFGGCVSRLGLMVRHLLPAAFADVSDVWSMPTRARQAVFLAGPASTAVWSTVATALWAWTPVTSPLHLLCAAVMVASFFSVFTSLNPVTGYDGTEVLAEWLGVAGLHRRALQYGWGRLRGRPPSKLSAYERRVFVGYSLAFLAYNVAVVALILTILLRRILL